MHKPDFLPEFQPKKGQAHEQRMVEAAEAGAVALVRIANSFTWMQMNLAMLQATLQRRSDTRMD